MNQAKNCFYCDKENRGVDYYLKPVDSGKNSQTQAYIS